MVGQKKASAITVSENAKGQAVPARQRSHLVRLVRPSQRPNNLLIDRLSRQRRDRVANLSDYCCATADKDEVYLTSFSQFTLWFHVDKGGFEIGKEMFSTTHLEETSVDKRIRAQ